MQPKADLKFSHGPSKHELNRTSLLELAPGEDAKITGIHRSAARRRRLLEMGIVPGTPVQMVQSAPLGGPVHIKIRGYQLCLRREDALLVGISK